jgi:ABC-type transporter Mla subunit MlaD
VGTALSTNVADAVTGTASIANRLARFVEVVERFIPGNTDSLAEDLREFADGIEPVPDQLRTLGAELATTSDEIEAASASLGPVSDQLTSTASDLAAATTDIEQAASVANEIAARAQAQLDASNSTFTLAKVLLFVLALVIALTCVAGERVISVAQRRSAGQRA